MKKLLSIVLIITFVLSSVLPAFGQSINVFDVTTDRDSYKQGELVNYTIFLSKDGSPLAYRDITIVIENQKGDIVSVAQPRTNTEGVAKGSYLIATDNAPGSYIIKANNLDFSASKEFKVLVSKAESTISTVKSSYYTDETVKIDGVIIENGNPKAFIDASVVIYAENGDIVLIGQPRSDSSGKFTMNYKYSLSETVGKRIIKMTIEDITISHEFEMKTRPVVDPKPVDPKPVDPTPGGGTTSGGNPTGGATSGGTTTSSNQVSVKPKPLEVKEKTEQKSVRIEAETNQSEKLDNDGEIVIEVSIETKEIEKLLKDTNSNIVSIKIEENKGNKIEVKLPRKLMLQDEKTAKNIEVESNNLVMLIQPNAFEIKDDDEIIFTIDENESLQPSSTTNNISKIYDFNFISKATNKKIKFSKPVQVKIPYEYTETTNVSRLGLYRFNEELKKWDYAGGKVDSTNNLITAELNHFSRYTVLEYTKEFDDFTENHWAYKEAEVMIGRHIINGMSETKFEPDAGLTIAQFIALIVRTTNLELGSEVVNIKNLEENQWYYNEAKIAASNGIIDSSGILLADELITREQMAVIVAETLKVLGYKPNISYSLPLEEYPDVELITPDSKEAVAFVTEIQIFKGDGDGFDPLGNAKRSEATAVIYRIMKYLDLL